MGEQKRIMYGGSVKLANVDELIAQAAIDGTMVGGATLDADSSG
jgi:triosephosphate isomerase (TIM)